MPQTQEQFDEICRRAVKIGKKHFPNVVTDSEEVHFMNALQVRGGRSRSNGVPASCEGTFSAAWLTWAGASRLETGKMDLITDDCAAVDKELLRRL